LFLGKKTKKSKQVSRLPGENFHKPSKDLRKHAIGELLSWRHDVWRKRPFSCDSPDDISPEIVVRDGNIRGLAERLYMISTHERLDFVVKTWISVTPLSEAKMDGLWEKAQALNV
jgi:hypothetical protein